MVLLVMLAVFYAAYVITCIVLIITNRKKLPQDICDYDFEEKRNEAVSKFVNRHELGSWSWESPEKNIIRISAGKHSNMSYKLKFNQFVSCIQGKETLEIEVGSAQSSEGTTISEEKKRTIDKGVLAQYFQGVLSDRNEEILHIAEQAQSDGYVWVYGADFNNQEFPDRNTLEVLASVFNTAGFTVTSLNFNDGSLRLEIAE